jgi:hypothetical protein
MRTGLAAAPRAHRVVKGGRSLTYAAIFPQSSGCGPAHDSCQQFTNKKTLNEFSVTMFLYSSNVSANKLVACACVTRDGDVMKHM